MAYIPDREWQTFVSKLSRVNAEAGRLVSEWIAKNGVGNRKALLGFCYEVAYQYGNASAALAAIMYDQLAEAEGVVLPEAEMADAPTFTDVAISVNGTLKTSEAPESVAAAVERLVKLCGQDTLLYNGIRDGAEWAWIPSGDTCAFCITLASKGWQRASQAALKGGHAEHIHGHCDCTYAIRHTSTTNIRGYDPDRYRKMYNNADGDTTKEKINAMRRQFYEEDKERINAQKRAAYEVRKELDSSQAEETRV